MTAYIGGKNRIGKEIANIIIKLNVDNLPYLEPFVGMMGITRHLPGKKLITDLNPDLVSLWTDIFNDTMIYPETITKEEFYEMKKSSIVSSHKCFVLAACCFSGCYGVSYALNFKGGQHKIRRAKHGLEKVRTMINKDDITFLEPQDYSFLNPVGFCIYCDPPYQNTCQKTYPSKFDSTKFWETMRVWSKTNLVIISELVAPDDFKCIWTKDIHTSNGASTLKRNVNNQRRREEKLFIYHPNHTLPTEYELNSHSNSIHLELYCH